MEAQPGSLADPSIRLLGPVEVSGASGLSPRERALLARLALDTGRTVTVDRLVDDLWGEDPPTSAHNALQVYVSHLRARLGRASIVSRGRGYRLELGADRVDSIVFERLLAVAMGLRASGRPADAIDSLDSATDLWRGPPLGDLESYAFARVEAARLHELRATCVEHLAEALLSVGELDRLTDELRPLVREFPFRDRLRAAVMTGLYRQGRAVDALALYAEVVDLLRDELGLEPGPALKALQLAILSDDPGLGGSLPSGEVTLVATVLDAPAVLEGQVGDAYGDVLLAHRDLLRAAFAACSGLSLPTDGERLLAVFPRAADAVRAAVSGHRALAQHCFAHDAVVRVRIGVHTGSPRIVERHYVGVDVQRVLNVALAASDGQTLVTEPTAAQLDGDALDGAALRLTDLGVQRLHHAAQPERLLQVAHPDESFPPPRTLGGRTSLPRTAVPLVGRTAHLDALLQDVGRPGSSVTTLLGPGGTGKTRLAIEVADRAGQTMAGGVYFVPLETARTLGDVWAGVAISLGLPADTPRPDAVLSRLSAHRTLLVLDNLEQLSEVAVVIEDLLGIDGELSILATSRRATGVPGERLHHLEPLADEPGRADASTLFAAYAELARPGFVIDGADRSAVERICRRVDGLPLGIELAAARVRHLPVRVLADLLESGRGLTVGGPSRPGRQRDLHALTDWSFRLLEPHQQRLLELLSLFVGGVDLDDLAGIPVTALGRADPVATALELADASLVRIADDAVARITLLETIREYAAGSLASSGRTAEGRDAHLAVQVGLARRLDPRAAGRTSTRTGEALLRDRDNVESALDWALASGQQDAAAEVLTCIGEAWHQLGPRALAYIERTAASCSEQSPFRGWLTYWDYRRRWDTETDDRLLVTLLDAAEKRLRDAGDVAPLAALLAYGPHLGREVGLGRDWGVARASEAVALAQGLRDDWLLSVTGGALARELMATGRADEAAAPLDQATAAAARRGDVSRLDSLTMTEAELVAMTGRPREAWMLAVPAAVGLVSSRSEGALWHATSTLAGLAAGHRPAAAATLAGIGLGALHRMGSIPSADDLARLRDEAAAAINALGRREFDRLVAHSRSWPIDTAVPWVLDLLSEPPPAEGDELVPAEVD